jgi:hypothetical protein
MVRKRGPHKTHNQVIDSRTPPRYHSLTLPPVIVSPVIVPPDTILYTSCGSYTAEHARRPDAVATASSLSPLEFALELGQDGGHASLSLGYGKRLRKADGRTGVGVSKEVFEAVGLQKPGPFRTVTFRQSLFKKVTVLNYR